MKILLIAGHGAGDPGAIGCGYREADLTRELVTLVKPLLEGFCDVTVYDFNRKMAADLKTKTYNFKAFDYVLEFHFNAANTAAKGTEVLTHTKSGKHAVNTLILENMKVLGFNVRGEKKRADLIVMNNCFAQGVNYSLFETCFIDNQADMTLYETKKHLIASAVANAIIDGFNLKGSVKMKELKDIKGHYAEKHIKDLFEMGVVNGDENGNFRPDDKLTRADAAIMVRNAIRAASGR